MRNRVCKLQKSKSVRMEKGEEISQTNARLWAHEYFGPYAGYANQYLFHDRRLQGRG